MFWKFVFTKKEYKFSDFVLNLQNSSFLLFFTLKKLFSGWFFSKLLKSNPAQNPVLQRAIGHELIDEAGLRSFQRKSVQRENIVVAKFGQSTQFLKALT